jgi:hypothetical protein
LKARKRDIDSKKRRLIARRKDVDSKKKVC